MTEVPIERVALIASRGECYAGCRHRDCDAARLAYEVLRWRLTTEPEGASDDASVDVG